MRTLSDGNADSWALSRNYIEIQYHDCEGVPDFVILYSRFQAAMKRELTLSESVQVLFEGDQNNLGTIVDS